MKMNHQIIPHRIALWGPAGSGKTWLIHAFGRSLVNFKPDDPNFYYELRDFSGETFEPPVMPIAPPRYQPTNELVDFMWMFSRQAKQNTYGHQISTRTHILHIHDVGGNDAIGLTEPVKQTYANVQLLLVLMDPMGVAGSPQKTRNHQTGYDADRSAKKQEVFRSITMTQESYLTSIKRLLDYVSESGGVRPLVAICLTKRDLWKKGNDPESAIKGWFGQQMFDMLSQYGREFTLKTFATSSCGYMDDTDQKPNYNKRTGELRNISQWNPHRVVQPFFWFLEFIERQELNQANSFWGNLVGRNPLKEYIGYPFMNDSLT